MEIIDQTKQVLLKDKPFMTLTEAARYTGVGQHKLSELSDDPKCEFVFWVGKSGCLSVRSLLTTCPRLTPSEPKSNVQRGGFAPLCTFGIQTKNQYPFIIYKPNRRVTWQEKKSETCGLITATSD